MKLHTPFFISVVLFAIITILAFIFPSSKMVTAMIWSGALFVLLMSAIAVSGVIKIVRDY